MNLPFTTEQFLANFTQYNETIWPLQIVLYGLAIIALAFLFKKPRHADTGIALILGCLWLWMGAVYHLGFFSAINPLSTVFGALFILQGMLFLWYGVQKDAIRFTLVKTRETIIGAFFIAYGLAIYPLLGYVFGHVYPESPTFGAPCPTTIYTFGLLLFTTNTFPKRLLIIPLLWSFIGFTAALTLGITEDVMLLVSGIVTTALLIRRNNPKKTIGVHTDSNTQGKRRRQRTWAGVYVVD